MENQKFANHCKYPDRYFELPVTEDNSMFVVLQNTISGLAFMKMNAKEKKFYIKVSGLNRKMYYDLVISAIEKSGAKEIKEEEVVHE